MEVLNTSIFGTIISMVLIYSLLSILVSILLEFFNTMFNVRSKNQETNIYLLLGDFWGNEFYQHYMISGQTSDPKKKPDDISDDVFTEVFIDILWKNTQKEAATEATPFEELGNAIKSMEQNPKLKELLEDFIFKSKGDFEAFKKYLKNWYNDFMKRTSGWYKKKQRPKLFLVGLLVAFLLNVDSVFLFNVIGKNDALRNELLAVAENVSEEYKQLDAEKRENINELLKVAQTGLQKAQKQLGIDSTQDAKAYLEKVEKLLQMTDQVIAKESEKTLEAYALVTDVSLPIGWKKEQAPLSWMCDEPKSKKKEEKKTALEIYIHDRNQNGANFPLYLFGIFVTAFSLSFGAPFWFELLVKFVDLRNIGKSKKTTNDPEVKKP